MDTALALKALATFAVIAVELVVLFFIVALLVGLLQAYVLSGERAKKTLSLPYGVGNVMGALIGAITPFCSCSTVPILSGLLRSGVGFGVAATFLLASPLLNPIIIAMLWMSFGFKVTALYAGSTFVLVVLAGMLWESLGLEGQLKSSLMVNAPKMPKPSSFKEALMIAAGLATMQLRQMLPYLLIGVSVGAVLYGLVPESFVVKYAGPDNPIAIPFAAVIGIPLYVRAETMIPIGIALMGKGMSVGAIVALLIGGSGASIPEVSMLTKLFKPRLIGVFLMTILLIASAAGYLFDYILVADMTGLSPQKFLETMTESYPLNSS